MIAPPLQFLDPEQDMIYKTGVQTFIMNTLVKGEYKITDRLVEQVKAVMDSMPYVPIETMALYGRLAQRNDQLKENELKAQRKKLNAQHNLRSRNRSPTESELDEEEARQKTAGQMAALQDWTRKKFK